jgi:hypothetical protein
MPVTTGTRRQTRGLPQPNASEGSEGENSEDKMVPETLQEGDLDDTMNESLVELTPSEEDEERGFAWNERESNTPDEQANIEGGGTGESDDDLEGICVMSPSKVHMVCY